MKKVISNSLEETEKLAKEWLYSLDRKTDNTASDSAIVVGLYGNLGSGKTAFTQAVARALGIQEAITSPTFVIEKIYEVSEETEKKSVIGDGVSGLPFARLIHIDAYRLESGRELQLLDFESLVENPNNLIIIEWPENVKEILPKDHVKIFCEFVDEGKRSYKFE